MGVAVLWTALLTLAHQRCKPIPSACGVRQVTHGNPSSSACNPTILEEASTQVQSLTYVDDIYFVGAPDKMPGVIPSLQQQKNLGTVNLNSAPTSPGLQGNA